MQTQALKRNVRNLLEVYKLRAGKSEAYHTAANAMERVLNDRYWTYRERLEGEFIMVVHRSNNPCWPSNAQEYNGIRIELEAVFPFLHSLYEAHKGC